MKRHLIFEYIKLINESVPNAKEIFTQGNCGSFARMLLFAFPDGIIYDYMGEHFVFGFGGSLYDITGDVTKEYEGDNLTNMALCSDINQIMAELSPKYEK